MNIEHQAHLTAIQKSFTSALNAKYARGQAEHGGNLWERPCLTEMGDEIVDLVTYFHCVRERITQLQATISLARELLSKGDYVCLEETLDSIYHLLKM